MFKYYILEWQYSEFGMVYKTMCTFWFIQNKLKLNHNNLSVYFNLDNTKNTGK